jgi:hypothetical protein
LIIDTLLTESHLYKDIQNSSQPLLEKICLAISCIFAWDFWFRLFQRAGLQILAPQIGEEFFDN